jgi:hypothetical protein
MQNIKYFIIGLLLITGCTTEQKSPAFTYQGAYSEMFNPIYNNLLKNFYLKDSHWPGDWGDANGYGPALIYSMALNGQADPNAISIANSNLNTIMEWINNFTTTDLISMNIDNLQNIFLGIIGLYYGYMYSRSPQYTSSIKRYLDIVDNFVGKDITGIFSLSIPGYDPSITLAMIADYNILYGLNVSPVTPSSSGYANYGLDVINQMNQLAYDPIKGYYKPNLSSDTFWLFPNALMIMAQLSAYRYTNDPDYLKRAESLYNVIKSLTFSAATGGYKAPDEENPDVDYLLSVQNYMITVDLILYHYTGDQSYLDNARVVLDFIKNNLYLDGCAYHHLEGGGMTHFFCTGCNLQLLLNIYEYNLSLNKKERFII